MGEEGDGGLTESCRRRSRVGLVMGGLSNRQDLPCRQVIKTT